MDLSVKPTHQWRVGPRGSESEASHLVTEDLSVKPTRQWRVGPRGSESEASHLVTEDTSSSFIVLLLRCRSTMVNLWLRP
jgi:hypothetical protein